VVWIEACPSRNCICSICPPDRRHNFAHVRRRSWGVKRSMPTRVRVVEHDFPNRGCAQRRARHLSILSYRPKYLLVGDLCRFGPEIETIFHPGRDGHHANAFALADQVWNRPAIVAHLDLFENERDQLRPPQAAANQKSVGYHWWGQHVLKKKTGTVRCFPRGSGKEPQWKLYQIY
jgi:hypothetical protein